MIRASRSMRWTAGPACTRRAMPGEAASDADNNARCCANWRACRSRGADGALSLRAGAGARRRRSRAADRQRQSGRAHRDAARGQRGLRLRPVVHPARLRRQRRRASCRADAARTLSVTAPGAAASCCALLTAAAQLVTRSPCAAAAVAVRALSLVRAQVSRTATSTRTRCTASCRKPPTSTALLARSGGAGASARRAARIASDFSGRRHAQPVLARRRSARLLAGCARSLAFAADVEITLEANPGTIERGRFADYRAAGVNRVSLGAQSFAATQLQLLGRIHAAADTQRAVEELHAAGIDNFNLDLMYGLPQQSLAAALADLDRRWRWRRRTFPTTS